MRLRDGTVTKTAADTNVIVRILARDEANQLAVALAELAENGFFLDTTIVIEIEWVLRGLMKFDRSRVLAAMTALYQLPQIEFAEPDRVATAIDWHAAGMDFADALHLAGSSDCDELVTFDRDFARRAQDAPDTIPVRLL